MLNRIINKIIESKVNGLRKNSKKEFIEWNNLKSVCILAAKDEFYKESVLTDFIKSLGKEVDVVLFLPGREISSVSDFISFNKKQTSIIGLPKAEVTAKITSKVYDLLIDCNFKEYNSMKWLAGSLNAKFKVGFGGLLYHNYFDICMDLKEKPESGIYLKQVENYLRMIRTKN